MKETENKYRHSLGNIPLPEIVNVPEDKYVELMRWVFYSWEETEDDPVS